MSGQGSFDCLRWAEDQRVGAVGVKATLMALARFAGMNDNDLWCCYPGQERLAWVTEQGVRTIIRHVSTLSEAGLLCHQRRPRVDGRGRTSNLYFLHVGAHCPMCGWTRDDTASTGQNGTLKSVQGATGDTTKVPFDPSSKCQALAEEVPENYQRESPEPSSSPSEPSRPVNQNRETARRITRGWWDAQDPKPTTKFIGAVQVVEKLVRAGWTEAEISAACAQCPTLSAGWLEPKLREIRNPRQTNGWHRPTIEEQEAQQEADDARFRMGAGPAGQL